MNISWSKQAAESLKDATTFKSSIPNKFFRFFFVEKSSFSCIYPKFFVPLHPQNAIQLNERLLGAEPRGVMLGFDII